MITYLHLRNLKCFRALSLPIAPLTLLTGFNAAGKSTALQALLLLGQAARGGRSNLHIALNGPLVRLGTAGEILNERAEDDLLTLGVESERGRIEWKLKADDRSGGTTLRVQSVDLAGKSGARQAIAPDQNIDFFASNQATEFGEVLEKLRELVFLSAVRVGSADTFPSPEATEPVHADVGIHGEFAPWWFERCLDDEVSRGRCNPKELAPTLRRQLDAWAGELFPGAEANAIRIQRTTLVQLQLRNHKTDNWRRPANIGYGLTYAFPILVAALLAKAGQVLIIDSPEAHLHPRAQSLIGTFLARISAAGVQILVETHSDHVLNGVRIAVRDGILPSSEVAVHFFNLAARDQSDPAAVLSTQIDPKGQISAWPAGFFDQAEKDLAKLADWT